MKELNHTMVAVPELVEGGETTAESTTVKAAFFLKPYPQEKLFERIEWIRPYASHIGIDIDSYNIVTMRNLVNLERKAAAKTETSTNGILKNIRHIERYNKSNPTNAGFLLHL